MSNYYHTPIPSNAPMNAGILNEPLAELDRTLWLLSKANVNWINRAVAPGNPAAGFYRLYVRSSALRFLDSAGNETAFFAQSYAVLRYAAGGGGDFSSGAWRTRPLNNEYDPAGIVGLAANQFTLQAGTYRIRAIAVAYAVGTHQTRLQNVTDATTTLEGSPELAPVLADSDSSFSSLAGLFTIAAAKTFELQHRCSNTQLLTGMGYPEGTSGLTDVYTIVELWKL